MASSSSSRKSFRNIKLMLVLLKAPDSTIHPTYEYLVPYHILMTFLMILPSIIYAHDITLNSKCDQVSALWNQLELPSWLEFVLTDILHYGGKSLLISMLVLFSQKFLWNSPSCLQDITISFFSFNFFANFLNFFHCILAYKIWYQQLTYFKQIVVELCKIALILD